MENQELTTESVQKSYRTGCTLENGLTVSLGYIVAEKIVNKTYPSPHPAGHRITDSGMVRPIKNRPEPPAGGPPLATLGGTPCLIHVERSFTFADGSVMQSCSHSFCGFGKTHKRHSDGHIGGVVHAIREVEPDESEIEDQSPDDSQELQVPTFASSDEPTDEDLRVEAAIEEAATESDERDGGDE